MVDSALKQRLFEGAKNLKGGASGSGSGSGSGLNASNFFQLLNEKKTFLIAVFSNLIVQLGITYWTMMHYPVSKQPKFWLIIAQFALIFVLAFVTMPSWIKFILFSTFSFIWGILFSSYRENPAYSGLIQFAVTGTAGIFAAMIAIGALLILFGVQLGLGVASGLFFALLLLIIVQLVSIFTTNYSPLKRWFSGFALVLFSLYIIYDTNHILQRNYYGDFITASMDYYLDIINIFLDILNLSSGGR